MSDPRRGEDDPPYARLRQVCLVAPALGPAVDAMTAVFGNPVCFRDGAVGRYGLENALFAFGPSFVEIVAPTRPDTAAGRFLARSGGVGGYMAIFSCSDPERRRAHAEAMGVAVAHVIDHPGFHAVQLHPRDCRGAMIEFDRTEGGADLLGPYHPAGGLAWRAVAGQGQATGIAAIELAGPDPEGMAAHWARLLRRPYRHEPAGAAGAVPVIDDPLTAMRFVPGDGRECLRTLVVRVRDPDAVGAAAARQGLDPAAIELGGVRLVTIGSSEAASGG